MKKKRHTENQIVSILEQASIKLANGSTVAEVCREFGVHEVTYHRWKKAYGGMEADQLRKLKDLEKENSRLKRIVADQAIDLAALKDIAEGKF